MPSISKIEAEVTALRIALSPSDSRPTDVLQARDSVVRGVPQERLAVD